MLAGLPWSFLCLCCGSGQNLYLLWRGPTVITSNTYHTVLHPGGFFTCGRMYFQLSTKSCKPKGNIKSQLLICLLLTALIPFIRSPCLRSFWHLRGVFFEVRVSQTILITPVAHFSHAGLDGGKELKLWLCLISGALKQ